MNLANPMYLFNIRSYILELRQFFSSSKRFDKMRQMQQVIKKYKRSQIAYFSTR